MINIAERHQFIINELKNKGQVFVPDLCQKLDVSSVTIRKDLKFLEDKDLLYRIHGGAKQTNPYAMDRPVDEKEKLQADEKDKIGMRAASQIEVNDSIIIASGTTVLYVARHIKPKEHLTVITSALQVASAMLGHKETEVIMLGGTLRKTSSSVMGPYAENTLKDFFCSKLYLGVDGIDSEYGLTTTNVMEAHLNRQMIAVAQKTIVVADSTKFGRRGFGRICGLEDIDEIITDSGVPTHVISDMEAMGVKVTVV